MFAFVHTIIAILVMVKAMILTVTTFCLVNCVIYLVNARVLILFVTFLLMAIEAA